MIFWSELNSAHGNVIAASIANGVRRLVYTSSLDVVGGGLQGADESWPYAKRRSNGVAVGYFEARAFFLDGEAYPMRGIKGRFKPFAPCRDALRLQADANR